jgi:hypothetical protein
MFEEAAIELEDWLDLKATLWEFLETYRRAERFREVNKLEGLSVTILVR